MQEERKQNPNDHNNRLQTLAVPKRTSNKFEKHPYIEGRYNSILKDTLGSTIIITTNVCMKEASAQQLRTCQRSGVGG